jgi:acyl carrier protein
VIDDKLIVQLDHASLNGVMRPKVAGSWLLHKLFKDQPLDFFVLFSSLGSLVGQTGQGNYAAANAFLDALVHERQANGMPGISINWGAWGGLGFAVTPGGKRVLEKLELQGLEAFSTEQGLGALELLLHQPIPQAVVLPINLTRFQLSGLARDRLWQHLLQEQSQSKLKSDKASQMVRETLLALPVDQQHAFLQTHVQTVLAQVLRMSPERIGPNAPLGSLGLESLLAVEFRNRLEASLNVKLAATLVWNYPTVFDITTFLLKKFDSSSQPSQPTQLTVPESQSLTPDSNKVIQKVQAMSDEDALLVLKNRRKGK